MYDVKLINNNVEAYINVTSTDPNAPRITGSIKQGINTIDSFTFDIYPNNPGYTQINPFGYKYSEIFNKLYPNGVIFSIKECLSFHTILTYNLSVGVTISTTNLHISFQSANNIVLFQSCISEKIGGTLHHKKSFFCT